MKFIRNFEGYSRTSLNKKSKKIFLNKENEKILSDFLIKYIDDENVLEKVKKLKFHHIAKYDFIYENIFDDILANFKINYTSGNIYYDTDIFIYNTKIEYGNKLVLRNSMIKIINKYWLTIQDKFSKILDNKLINYFNKHHDIYEESLALYGDEISDNVKKECQWIIDHQKYNL